MLAQKPEECDILIEKALKNRDLDAAVALYEPNATLVLDSRSEEHTSELQSQSNLVCRLLLEKKKKLTAMSLISQLSYTIQHISSTFRSFPTPYLIRSPSHTLHLSHYLVYAPLRPPSQLSLPH